MIAADPLAAIFTWKLSFKSATRRRDFQASIVWWIIIATVGAYILGRTPVRQLDRRRRRLAERGAQPRRPGRAGEDHAVRHDGLLGGDPGRHPEHAASHRPTSCAAAASSSTAITTAVIGGCLLTGGYGSVAGTALGALALGMAQIGHRVRLRSTPTGTRSRLGTLLLSAVVLNNWIRRRFAGLR